uniref:Uncharacterized protein n=1 Tax=Candidatus Kentrum sp. DK TaxID=2126562 RepID=A0A450TNP9_9GAMM|nr:MAG: hypothetical protein BECKDK2373B_GA0170837_12454 [Candidatus Kentron sp. DK]
MLLRFLLLLLSISQLTSATQAARWQTGAGLAMVPETETAPAASSAPFAFRTFSRGGSGGR